MQGARASVSTCYIEEYISGILVIFEDLWYFSLQAYFSKCHFLKFSVTLKKNYFIDFLERGTELL